MSRKKKKGKYNPPPSVVPVAPAKSAPVISKPEQVTPPLSVPVSSVGPLSFDSLEDKIRGEEMMLEQENRKLRESREIKKKLEESEVDKRLEELRKQLGLSKK